MKNPRHEKQCRGPYCKNIYTLVYLGLKVCQECFADYCQTGDPDLRTQAENLSKEDM